MFIRFRQSGNRLQCSLVETHRVAGRNPFARSNKINNVDEGCVFVGWR
jgi:hypothetical protein